MRQVVVEVVMVQTAALVVYMAVAAVEIMAQQKALFVSSTPATPVASPQLVQETCNA
jgi:hypothetical protein